MMIPSFPFKRPLRFVHRSSWLAAVVVCCAAAWHAPNSSAEEIPGIVAEKPSEGRFVETDRGYMVPYTATIPGTNVQFEMLPVPGGKFVMGSPESEADSNEDERPQIEVSVSPFWIGKYEVTWAEYKSFMEMYDLFKDFEGRDIRQVNDQNQGDSVTAPTPLYDPTFTFVIGEEPRQPAVTMSHYAARQYTKWLSLMSKVAYRLPTEAEWEYAARAGTKTAYSFGDDASQLGEFAWFYDNSDDAYHEVGMKKPNPWGLYDVHGNVAEMVLDQYQEDTYTTNKSDGKVTDPVVWGSKMFSHVIRGGGWYDDANVLRSAARAKTDDWREEDPNIPRSPWWFTDEPALSVGFRLVRPLTKPTDETLKKAWEPDSEMLQQAVSDRITEGRGALGLVDPELPAAADQ